MEVILLERIEKLGQMGEVVKVKPGFARNYLLPQKKALRATKENLTHFEGQRHQLEAENLKRRQEAEAVAAKMDGLDVVIIRSAGDSGQLYGSVNARDISEAVTEGGFTIDRQQVVIDRPVKELGFHSFRIRLHPEVTAGITVNVARSQEEAATQAKLGRAIISSEEEDRRAEAEAAAAAAAAEAERYFESPADSPAESPADLDESGDEETKED